MRAPGAGPGDRPRIVQGRSRIIPVSHHGPVAHPCIMKIGYHRPAAARATSIRLGTGESAVSLTWELSAPRIVAFEHAEQNRERGSSSAPRSDWWEEAQHGATTRTVRGAGRPSGHGGGMCAGTGAGRVP